MAYPFGTSWWMQSPAKSAPDTGARYVAVGDGGTIITSPDAVKWELANTGGFAFNGVAYGNGMFIAVGGAGRVCRSDDGGETWSDMPPLDVTLNSIIFESGLFLSCGNFDFSAGRSSIFVSPDGVQWTSAEAPVNVALNGIAYGAGVYVAVGNARIAYSEDLLNWQMASGVVSYNLTGVSYGLGRFIAAVGVNQNVFNISINGMSWTTSSANGAQARNFIAFGNDTFVSGGASGSIRYSKNGTSWTVINPAVPGAVGVHRGGTFGGGRFVIVGSGAQIITSEDGIIWARRSPPAGLDVALRGVAYGDYGDVSD